MNTIGFLVVVVFLYVLGLCCYRAGFQDGAKHADGAWVQALESK